MPPVDPASLTISSLLAEHHNDPHRALATLVSRFNRLAADHTSLRQDRDAALQASERAAQENHQLWRSLKALGTAASPRPSALRQNSDHSAGQGVRGLGLETPSSRGLRRGPSSESNSARLDLPTLSASFGGANGGGGGGGGSSSSGATSQHSSPRTDADFASSSAFSAPHDGPAGTGGAPRSAEPSPRFASAAQFSSPAAGRTKAATPPPSHGSPRAHDALAASGLRKASSLDLGRGGGGPDADPASAAAGAAGLTAAAPASPGGEGLRMPHDEQLSPRTPPQGDKAFDPRRRRSSPRMMTGSSSMPMLSDPAMDRRLLPSIQPVSPFFVGGGGGGDDSGSRSASSRDPNSASSSAGEHLQQQLHHHPASSRTADLASSRRDRTLSTNSSSSLANSALPDPALSSSSSRSASSLLQDSVYSMRERRPSAPSSRLAHAALGPHDTDLSTTTTASASAPSSRRPSALNFGGGGAQLASQHQQQQQQHQQAPLPSPHPPRTPTVRPAAPPAPPSLTPAQLAHARVRVASSNIRLSERGKEVVSFVVDVELPASSPSSSSAEAASVDASRWRVEKKHADVLALDAAVRSKASRSEAKGLASLPDKNLFKDHAPHKSDQRKALVERYLQTLVAIPFKDRSPICAFLTSDVVVESPTTPSSAHGSMEGWLTKRGRNFGGWQTRFYVLTPGSALAYYDAPGGTKLGEIPLQSAAIGRQSSSRAQPSTSSSSSSSAANANGSADADDAYLHAFLIRTQSDEKHGHHEADHILCAENDEQRDRWVQALTTLQPRGVGASSSSSAKAGDNDRERALPDAPSAAAPPVPTVVSTEPDSPAQPSAPKERRRSGSGPPSSTSALVEHGGPSGGGLSVRSAGEPGLPPSVSLPSDLHALARGMPALEGGAGAKKIATISEGNEGGAPGSSSSGSATAAAARSTGTKLHAPSSRRPSGDRPLSPSRTESPSSSGGPPPPPPPAPPQPSASSATKYSASDVSGPMNAVPLPSGYDFKKAERQKKTKSSFWNFASRGSSSHNSSAATASGDRNSATSPGGHAPPARPVFGVPLPEAVAISRIRPGLELPAIVYRCVEYLEAKNAEHEEGIFRLSGSANVIRLLKERFNAEGDVNLLQSAEYYDPHAVAGLLKQYLRELPDHLLTRELHNEFLRVIDLRDRRDRVNALGKLVARLPIEEYTLFRFFFAHLCLIAQNADTSKMNLRNLGIVFAPTLAIPQPLFSLFLVEFDLIFAVETETGAAKPIMVGEEPSSLDAAASSQGSGTDKSPRSGGNRNSQLYEASGAGELEQKLEKLRENDEADDLPADSGRPGPDEADHAGPPAGEQGSLNEAYEQPHGTGPLGAPLRSPGLPVSSRPGATF
ncbi:hypothetical protein JCM3775_004380 [Rhodotorula graminis]